MSVSLLHIFTLGSKLKEKIHETASLIAKGKIRAHALAPKSSALKWQTSFILTFHELKQITHLSMKPMGQRCKVLPKGLNFKTMA